MADLTLSKTVALPTGVKVRLSYDASVTATLLDSDGNAIRSPYTYRETSEDSEVASGILARAQAAMPKEFPT